MATAQKHTPRHAHHLSVIHHFMETFPPVDAHAYLHKMARAAFARADILTKRDVLDLVFFKDELSNLITVAAALAQTQPHQKRLEKFFYHATAKEWNETLGMLYYAALFDGFFTSPPHHTDIYHYCRGLHALVNACAAINEAEQGRVPQAAHKA